jgi:hypothetical protein
MASAGASAQVNRRLRVGVEVTATAGGQVGMTIPEASTPGDRSLTTLLVGVEPIPYGPRGAFGFVGLGVGDMNLSNAHGVFEPPWDERWLIPSRSLTAFAVGVAVGYRSGGGPGPLGFQVAFRSHALIHGGRLPASGYALTVGLAY